jgi:hypothetical protein
MVPCSLRHLELLALVLFPVSTLHYFFFLLDGLICGVHCDVFSLRQTRVAAATQGIFPLGLSTEQ